MGQDVVVDALRLGDRGERGGGLLQRRLGDRRPSGRSWRTGTRPSHSSACQAKWRACRARSSFAPAGVDPRDPAAEQRRPAASRWRARARPVRRAHFDDPDVVCGHDRSLRSTAACHAGAGPVAPDARPELRHRDAHEDGDAAGEPLGAETLAVDVPGDPGEHRLGEQDQRGPRRGDPPLPPQLQRQRERRARDPGEHDREHGERGERADTLLGRRRDRQHRHRADLQRGELRRPAAGSRTRRCTRCGTRTAPRTRA